jgi:cyclophilin family peptidyl-prolyl cis-trans isomerase
MRIPSRLRDTLVGSLRLTRAAGLAQSALEPLEPRLALSGSPLPTLADLESPNDTVVRLETNYGDIDIELFNSAAPITVSNFLAYVNSGRYGDSFFHRSAISPSPFVLQGGGFTYSDSAGENAIATDAPIIRETTGRSNLAQTIAMARTSVINSATSQFFINYVDNTFLDPTSASDGYAVFGKVIQGWSTVQTIEGLQSLDLSHDPAFAGQDAGAFTEVPVGSTFNSGAGVREADLVKLVTAEIIKPATVAGFFGQKVFYPEGFRSSTSVETLDMFNPNGVSGAYQVIVRYETGQRDAVIASGTLGANAKLSLTLSDNAQPGLNTVRSGVPYAVEVDSAFPETLVAVKPVSASMNRFDFNAATGEAYFNASTVSTPNTLHTWNLPRIERNDLSREFVVYQNLSDTAATVTTVFHTASGDFTVTRTLGPYRRGGLEVFNLGLPNGVLWARVSADQDIVAAVSDWDLPNPLAGPLGSATPGYAYLGTFNGGSTFGGYAGAQIRNNFTSIVSFANPGVNAADVTLTIWHASGGPTNKSLSVAPSGRTDLTLDTSDLGVAANEIFSITYTSTVPVAAQYTSFQSTLTSGRPSDGVSTSFAEAVPPVAMFADGQLDTTLPNGAQTETISIFNPFGASTVSFSYTVRYYFSDGTAIDGATGTLNPHSRIDIVSGSIAAVRNKAASNPAFRNYGIAVIGTGTNSADSTTTTTSGLVVLTRWDTSSGKAIASSPGFSAEGIPLNNPLFT